MQEGELTSSQYLEYSGLQALLLLGVDDYFERREIKFVLEPELIETFPKLDLKLSTFKKKLSVAISEYSLAKEQRPPGFLRLAVAKEAIIDGSMFLTPHEFEVLKSISKSGLVEEVEKDCELLDYQVTTALVSLRKKKAIKVVSNKDAV